MKEKEIKDVGPESNNSLSNDVKNESNQGLLSVLDDNISKRKVIGDKIFEKEKKSKDYFVEGEKEFWEREDILFHQLNDYFHKMIDSEKDGLIKRGKTIEKTSKYIDLVDLKFNINDLSSEIIDILSKSGFLMIDGKIDVKRAKVWFDELFSYDRKMNMHRNKRYNKWKWQFPLDISFGNITPTQDYYIFVKERISVQQQKKQDTKPFFTASY